MSVDTTPRVRLTGSICMPRSRACRAGSAPLHAISLFGATQMGEAAGSHP